MKTKDLFGIGGRLESMRFKKYLKKDNVWYKKVTNSEPRKVYRECPNCGKRTGIPIIYKDQWCFMCGETIYRDKKLNEQAKKKYEFRRKMKGIINENNKKSNRRKKMEKEIQLTKDSIRHNAS